MSDLYSEVFLLYEREGIHFEISEILIWDEVSPYTGATKEEMLAQFNNTKIEFNGDLAQLISNRTSGGLAYIDVLCHPEQKYHTSFASIYSTFSNVPIFSWSVYICTHEIGHNLGSSIPTTVLGMEIIQQ
ncbi:MAG: hypothetical protein IPO92_17985 [Saprospiraceae bacterium]|nr:hypothetical protein [Saprospiraceae bacterium]